MPSRHPHRMCNPRSSNLAPSSLTTRQASGAQASTMAEATTEKQRYGGNMSAVSPHTTKILAMVAVSAALWWYSPQDYALCYLPMGAMAHAIVRPKRPLEYLAAVVSHAVWAAHSMVVTKVLSLGHLPAAAGWVVPCFTVAFLLGRSGVGGGDDDVDVPSTTERTPHEHTHTAFSRLVVRSLWDPPLVASVLATKPLGVHIFHDGRGRFLSIVDDDLAVSSMPVASDVDAMAAAGVCAVVNMQDEWGGPVDAYERRGIRQLRLPTVDMESPSVEDLRRGVAWMVGRKRECPGGRVLVHCKGGRGRAAAMVVAYYVVAKGLTPKEAFKRLNRARRVVERTVLTYPAVEQLRAEAKASS